MNFYLLSTLRQDLEQFILISLKLKLLIRLCELKTLTHQIGLSKKSFLNNFRLYNFL